MTDRRMRAASEIASSIDARLTLLTWMLGLLLAILLTTLALVSSR
jgi:hypothetical protein